MDRKRIRNRKCEEKTPLPRQITLRKTVTCFLQEDVNSTLAPGKKDTITVNKIKKQKRYMNDILQNLYMKFTKEHTDVQLSYVSFSRLRPFWVVQKTAEQRDTSLCKLHENIRMRIEKLKQLEAITEKHPDIVAQSLVCSMNNKECTYRECKTCTGSTIELNPKFPPEKLGTQVTYVQ